ncbi:MAG: imidazolonepropionase [Acidobacteria bacterium]|nr:imidazolonepropionase [Acidobacteriota bacterium]
MPRPLLIAHCRQLVTLRGPKGPRRGRILREIAIIRDGAVLVHEGRIAAVGTTKQVERHRLARKARKVNAKDYVVLPGFVDSHTHLVFPASRADEYERRIAGATYEQIAKRGGGILSTVKKLRRVPADSVLRQARAWLSEFAAHGTTTLEAKSGYGLSLESELKILEIIKRLNREQPLELVPTFLGAHVVPPEYRKRPERYLELLVHLMIPLVAARGLAEHCDVFCDRGAFTPAQARLILTAGRVCGLQPRLHAEQLARTGGARLAVELHATSVDHLERINASDIRCLAASDTVCTLLPGAVFHLGKHTYAPARKLIEAGAIVALATDFNPGTAPSVSMPMALSLACNEMRMTPAEAISAATLNGAYALGRADRLGSLETGKQADLCGFELCDYREIPYYFGVNRCRWTLKKGQVIHDAAGQFPTADR